LLYSAALSNTTPGAARRAAGSFSRVKKVTVQVREDHLETLAKTKPMTALSELIWNALDADATDIRVEFVENDLGGVETIRIADNGHGLHAEDAEIVFQNLGGSWKRGGPRTMLRHRVLHGKFGKGRFRAFSLGNHVTWRTQYEEGGKRFGYTVQGHGASLGEFLISDARQLKDTATGMAVEIRDVPVSTELLRGVKASQEVTAIFSLYLRQYPDVSIHYDGHPLDPANAETRSESYELDEMVMENGERVRAELTVIEWDVPGRRGLYLCDADGFMRAPAAPKLHFRGFSYTAYLKSSHIALLDSEGLLQADDLSSDVRQLVDAARMRLREHFALREAENAQGLLASWREEGLYPYQGKPKDDNEANERRIFDIYATHLNQISTDFATSTPHNRRLVLLLIQELVRSEPTRVARILDSVLNFPEEKEEEILELARQ